ncbi:MAG: hypothetical protein HN855_10865 [Anaerolineae bacterium]|nr:hypothetical protein [Anaerolineae bacterium]MBT7069942.1 hypothetical protein [Anaerolineae bacterium]MBT7325653.1 hypothetical protein [Anaerolineae bacterium]
MDFETLYAYILVAAGIFSLMSAAQGKSIEAAEKPRLSPRISKIIYTITGLVLLFFGYLRLQ